MGSEQKRLVLALFLSGLVIFGWQIFFAPQIEVQPTINEEQASATPERKRGESLTEEGTQHDLVSRADSEEVAFDLEEFEIERDGHRFNFFNDLTISNIVNPGSVFDFKTIAGGERSFRIQLLRDSGPKDLFFDFTIDHNSNVITGVDERYGIHVESRILENGKLDFILRSDSPYRYRFIFDSWSESDDDNHERQFILLSRDVEWITVGDRSQSEASLKWFGLDHNYHLFAFILEERAPVFYESTSDGKLILDFVRPTDQFVGDLVFTKKRYETLIDLGNQLSLAVDFGFIGVIAVPMLHSMEWFYKFFPNYGVAIILLTLVIRTLLFPLSYASFKSMKKMQKLQPELTKLKEKHKDDPQKMQKETMELFKKSGANPLGGCLPLLLQMPIFFAFYRVLYSSVELVNAPFIFWIQDLSSKDPFYVLPFFMAITMFLQQKLMPATTMDATQRKIMLFLPVIFGFIMKDFPAGLNLYIAVSTLFGIIQQVAVYKMTD